MSSTTIVSTTHQAIKLAVSMPSNTNATKVRTVPEDTAQPLAESASASTLPKKQPPRNGMNKGKAMRTTSTATRQSAATEPDLQKPKHKRTNSSPLLSSTGPTTVESAPATPITQRFSVMERKCVTPKTTTGAQHLMNKPKARARGSFDGISERGEAEDVGNGAAATIATTSTSQHKDATQMKGVSPQTEGTKTATVTKKKKDMVGENTNETASGSSTTASTATISASQEKRVTQKASPPQNELTKTATANKKKKDAVGNTSKRLSSSTSKIKSAFVVTVGEELRGSSASPPRTHDTNNLPRKAKPIPALSTSKEKQTAASADTDKPGSGKDTKAVSSKLKQTTTSSQIVNSGEENKKPSLPDKQKQTAASTELGTIGGEVTNGLAADNKQMVASGKGIAKASSQSPSINARPKMKIRASQSTHPVSKSPPDQTRTQHSLSSVSATSPKRHSHQVSSSQVDAKRSQAEKIPAKFTGAQLATVSETSDATSARLSFTVHGEVPVPDTKTKSSSLDSSSFHGSSYAASDLYSRPVSRPSLPSTRMSHHSERIGSQRRRDRDGAPVPKPKERLQSAIPPSHTSFGVPLVPIDIAGTSQKRSKLNLMHHKDALDVLGEIKSMKRQQLMVKLEPTNDSLTRVHISEALKKQKEDPPLQTQPELKVIQLLKTAGTATSATLSMTGFKGGALEDQVNHDRSLIVSPFYLRNHSNSMVRRRLMGVFDGHAEHGSKFAEHCQQLLPSLLSRKLADAFKKAVEEIAAGIRSGEDEVAITKRVLVECFLSMDESSPNEASGGCTATVVYQQGQNVFVANTGDSRSFIAVYRNGQTNQSIDKSQPSKKGKTSAKYGKNAAGSPNCVKVVYLSREDKPDLPGERERLEGWGGEIIPAEGNKSAKVRFPSNRPGKASATLSMSRSIGDWEFTPLGVIPDPLVDVVDLKKVVETELKSSGKTDGVAEDVVDDVCVFAVCVSDGMMVESVDDAEAVASELAKSLFSDDGQYPLCACQSIVTHQAAVWDRRNKGKFRDDITIAVTALRAPAIRSDGL